MQQEMLRTLSSESVKALLARALKAVTSGRLAFDEVDEAASLLAGFA